MIQIVVRLIDLNLMIGYGSRNHPNLFLPTKNFALGNTVHLKFLNLINFSTTNLIFLILLSPRNTPGFIIVNLSLSLRETLSFINLYLTTKLPLKLLTVNSMKLPTSLNI